MSQCAVEGCPYPLHGTTWCDGHYRRFRRCGDVLADKPLKRKSGSLLADLRAAAFSDTDDCVPWRGSRYSDGRCMAATVCVWTHGRRPKGLVASHLCGNGHLPCVNSRHIVWETQQMNLARMREHGTLLLGEKHPNAKLTEDDVRAIRASGEFQKVLAARYGVSRENISMIKRYKSWAHIRSYTDGS